MVKGKINHLQIDAPQGSFRLLHMNCAYMAQIYTVMYYDRTHNLSSEQALIMHCTAQIHMHFFRKS